MISNEKISKKLKNDQFIRSINSMNIYFLAVEKGNLTSKKRRFD